MGVLYVCETSNMHVSMATRHPGDLDEPHVVIPHTEIFDDIHDILW